VAGGHEGGGLATVAGRDPRRPLIRAIRSGGSGYATSPPGSGLADPPRYFAGR
jgi:hypothetical protein